MAKIPSRQSERGESVKALIEFLAKSLVDQPDAVEVQEKPGDHGLVIELKVAPEDIGKIIGRSGRTIKALRQLLSAAASKSKAKVSLSLME
jgi:uncharacterized protein